MTAERCGCAETRDQSNYNRKNYIQIGPVINLSMFCHKILHVPFFVEQMLVQAFKHGVLTLTLILSSKDKNPRSKEFTKFYCENP